MKYKNLLSAFIFTFAIYAAACSGKTDTPAPPKEPVEELPDWEDNISGDVYDYSVTMAPERPYMHAYDKSMLIKLFLARPNADGTSHVGMTFEDVLKVIKGLDNLSRGVHKIVYLVGWQFQGHDSKYPAFNEFNEALKRPGDATATAQESFYRLQDEALKYNTTLSVHILLQDAYPNSPLWEEYVKNDFICKNAAGSLITRAMLNGLPMYDVNIVKEWKKGKLQKRLDDLVGLVRLDKTHTLHCDAFYARESPYHDVTVKKTETVMRKILRYMRDKEIDVTVEFMHNDGQRIDPMFGLNPAAWWLDLSADERAHLPASLVAGGQEGKFGTLWPMETFLFGDNYQAEEDFNFVDIYPDKNFSKAWERAKFGIATRSVPYLFYNTRKVLSYDAVNKVVNYSDGVVTDWHKKTVTWNGVLLRDNNDIFFPLAWKDNEEIMAYSQEGYNNREWKLPAGWEGVTSVTAYPLTENGLGKGTEIKVKDGGITLSLAPNSILSIQKP